MNALTRLLHRIATGIGDLLPSPPPADPPPPDIDGRHDAGEADDLTAFEVELQAKGGHGGTR